MKEQTILMNGNEAVAFAAMDANIGFLSHYPGSPVNNVEVKLKKLQEKHGLDIVFNDALNEHIAALSAMGASYSSVRSMLVMKHVGLNIAADPLTYAGYSGVKGGMVVVVGTDPGANSSTGEQDVHWYARMFNFPLYEPTNIQELYQNVIEAYKLSESYELPVFVFIPVELAHNISQVTRISSTNKSTIPHFEKDRNRYINVGKKAIDNHKILIDKMNSIACRKDKLSNTYFNLDAKLGIVTRGLTFGYVLEAILKLGLQDEIALLQVNRVFPIDKKLLVDFGNDKESIVFIEDQDGFLETMVKQVCFNDLKCDIHGKDIFPSHGALDSNMVMDYLRDLFKIERSIDSVINYEVEERLGTFCEGCPHTASYYSIFEVLEGYDYVLGGDIGCSSLPPFKADWLLCMNAGIGISQGIAMVSKDQLVVSTGGDGSFFHGGMISLQSAVENKVNLIHIVFDNEYVAMTGHQYSPSGGRLFNVEQLFEAIGVDRHYVVDVFEKNQFADVLRAEIGKSGVRVIWAKGACALVTNSKRGNIPFQFKVEIDNKLCGSCQLCYEKLACPAIKKDDESLLFSDENLCVRCGVCQNICPNEAITTKGII